MDFVVVGIVIGSIIVGCGVIIADLGPRIKPWLTRPDQTSIEPSKLKQSWSRYCKASGSLVSTGGLLMVLVTVLGVVFDVSDSTGMRAVLVAGLIALVAVALAAFVVPNHYRSGGFDARSRPQEARSAPLAAIVNDVSIPISDLPVDPDDIFVDVPEEPVLAETAEPELKELAAHESESVRETAHESGSTEYSLDDQPEEVELDTGVPQEFVPHESFDLESALTGFAVDSPEEVTVDPGLAFEPWVAEPRGPVAASRAAYERTQSGRIESTPSPLVDPPLLPLDDELPAWNAPVPVIEPPVVAYEPRTATDRTDSPATRRWI